MKCIKHDIYIKFETKVKMSFTKLFNNDVYRYIFNAYALAIILLQYICITIMWVCVCVFRWVQRTTHFHKTFFIFVNIDHVVSTKVF